MSINICRSASDGLLIFVVPCVSSLVCQKSTNERYKLNEKSLQFDRAQMSSDFKTDNLNKTVHRNLRWP